MRKINCVESSVVILDDDTAQVIFPDKGYLGKEVSVTMMANINTTIAGV
jgi:hypothetical protein